MRIRCEYCKEAGEISEIDEYILIGGEEMPRDVKYRICPKCGGACFVEKKEREDD